jgi:hypothetical protein
MYDEALPSTQSIKSLNLYDDRLGSTEGVEPAAKPMAQCALNPYLAGFDTYPVAIPTCLPYVDSFFPASTPLFLLHVSPRRSSTHLALLLGV